MYENSKWLQDMGLLKSIKPSVYGEMLRNVHEIVQYLTIDDLMDTSLLDAAPGCPRPGSREYLKSLSTAMAICRFRYALFQIILVSYSLVNLFICFYLL